MHFGFIIDGRIIRQITTNLKVHLKKHHVVQYQEVVQAEEDSAKKRKELQKTKGGVLPKGQPTLLQTLAGKTAYSKDSDRYQFNMKKLPIFIGSTNVPIRIVENDELRALIAALDPTCRYKVPGRTLINKTLDAWMAELKGNIQQHLLAVQWISLCADVWSKEGLTSSYLGITAYFFGRKDHKQHHVTLVVQRFLHPHTGECVWEVVQEVLAEWNIPLSKVFFYSDW